MGIFHEVKFLHAPQFLPAKNQTQVGCMEKLLILYAQHSSARLTVHMVIKQIDSDMPNYVKCEPPDFDRRLNMIW
jgi:hypothetical protein